MNLLPRGYRPPAPAACIPPMPPTNGAEVYVDDALVGKSPLTLNLKIGHHYARMLAKDYKNWSEQFTIVTGPELRLTAVLQKSN
jgi:hypothetical protein